MGLRDIGATLPPGFRFYPSDEELVCHYLYKKIANEEVLKGTLVEIDLHTCEPWQLPEVAKLNSTDWYFFSFRDRKYATGYRTNRATTCGYWKATGKDRTVVEPRSRAIVGMRKTLVFYKNRAPNGVKTGWIMHEFRLENPHIPPKWFASHIWREMKEEWRIMREATLSVRSFLEPSFKEGRCPPVCLCLVVAKEDWVLCRVFHKAKTENSEELSLQNMCETTTLPKSLNLADSQNQKLFPCGYNHHQNQNPNTNFLDLPALNPNFLHQSRGLNKAPDDEMANGDEDHYGFLFEMDFEEGGLGDVVPSNIDEMGFDDDIDDDHSLVFL